MVGRLGRNLGSDGAANPSTALAQRIGASESLVAPMEVGASRPRLETLLKVAAALNITFDIDGTGLHFRQGA